MQNILEYVYLMLSIQEYVYPMLSILGYLVHGQYTLSANTKINTVACIAVMLNYVCYVIIVMSSLCVRMHVVLGQ